MAKKKLSVRTLKKQLDFQLLANKTLTKNNVDLIEQLNKVTKQRNEASKVVEKYCRLIQLVNQFAIDYNKFGD